MRLHIECLPGLELLPYAWGTYEASLGGVVLRIVSVHAEFVWSPSIFSDVLSCVVVWTEVHIMGTFSVDGSVCYV